MKQLGANVKLLVMANALGRIADHVQALHKNLATRDLLSEQLNFHFERIFDEYRERDFSYEALQIKQPE